MGKSAGRDSGSVICQTDFIAVQQLCSIWFARSSPDLNQTAYNLEYTPKLMESAER